LLAVVCLASPAGAAAARLKVDAALHARPSGGSEVLGQVAAGARVEVLGESNGWREVKSGSARGFVRAEQLALGEAGEPAPRPAERPVEKRPERPPPRVPVPAGPSAEEFQRLAEDVRLLRERPEAATAADLQRLEAALSAAVAERCAPPAPVAAAPPPSPDASVESMLAVSPVLLLVGGVVGWAASRVLQRRRDHRHRIRV